MWPVHGKANGPAVTITFFACSRIFLQAVTIALWAVKSRGLTEPRLQLQTSLIPQRLHRIEARGKISGDQRRQRADQKCADTNDGYVLRHDLRRNFRELVDFARKNFDVQCRCKPMTEFVAITNQCHAEPEASECSEEADDGALSEKNPDDLRDVCAQRFHNSDLAPLLHGNGDECAHDSERCDDDYEKEEKKHHRPFEAHGFKILAVHVDPGFGKLWHLEKFLDFFFHALSAVGIVGLDRDAVERVAEIVKFLADVNRHEQKLGIMQIMAGLINPGDG